MGPEIVLIAAMDENKGIGKNGGMPGWNIPEDRRHFREATGSHPVIMGRKTLESLPNGQPLPKRRNIVISRTAGLLIPGCDVFHSIESALAYATILDRHQISVIGGGEIYRLALPYADILYLTQVQGDFRCDVRFPDYEDLFRRAVSETDWQESNGFRFRFLPLVEKARY